MTSNELTEILDEIDHQYERADSRAAARGMVLELVRDNPAITPTNVRARVAMLVRVPGEVVERQT
jgi:hypothetical protein